MDEPSVEPEEKSFGLSPLILGALITAAFVMGFFGVYLFKSRPQPEPVIVTTLPGQASPPPADTHFHPEKPEVSISAAEEGSPDISASEQQKIDNALADFPKGYDALEARDALAELGYKAIPALTFALSAPESPVRMNAAMTLNQIAAGSDDSPNSEAEVKALRPYFDHAKTVSALQKLWNDPDQATRLDACYAMANIGDKAAVPTLVQMAGDENVDVRAAVAYGIGHLKALDGIPTLLKLLNDHDLTVRVSAVEGMRPFDTPTVKSALSDRLAQETDPDIIERIKSVLQGEPAPDGGEGD